MEGAPCRVTPPRTCHPARACHPEPPESRQRDEGRSRDPLLKRGDGRAAFFPDHANPSVLPLCLCVSVVNRLPQATQQPSRDSRDGAPPITHHSLLITDR